MLVNPPLASNTAKTDDDANVTNNASNFSFTIPPNTGQMPYFFVVPIVAKVA
jgi:hypothetical protein